MTMPADSDVLLHVVGREANPFGAQLRRRRHAAGLTQVGLALRLSVRPQTIGAWERGTLRPQRRFLEALAAFMGLDGPSDISALLERDARGPVRTQAREETADVPASGTPTDPDWQQVIAELTAAVGERARQGPLARHEAALFRALLDHASQQLSEDV